MPDNEFIEHSCPHIDEVLNILEKKLGSSSYDEVEELMEKIRNINSQLREGIEDVKFKIKMKDIELESFKSVYLR